MKYYITTPIYYVNDVPHIGHVYTSVIADFFARFYRICGIDSFFLTGTDEHGVKVQKSALAKGIDPKKYVDQMSERFRDISTYMNISNNDFIRTTEERHKSFVQNIWSKMVQNGDVYLGTYSGFYSIRDEAFYSESDLVNGKAPTGADVEWLEQESYFFRLSQYQDRLLSFYEENPNFVHPKERYNEVIAFVKRGLKDLSISRSSFSWGIQVPNNEKHVIYVWLDALFNYLSAIDEKYWPCDLHIMGKDIVIFHAVYWPAFLMSLNYEMPKKIIAHGWWMNQGEKMSKSLGNVINPLELVNEFGADYVRYFFLREISIGSDGNYSSDFLRQKIRTDLVNNIGNLVNRVTSFLDKNMHSTVPSVDEKDFSDLERVMLDEVYATVNNVKNLVDLSDIQCTIIEVLNLSSKANAYVDEIKPWQLLKEGMTKELAIGLYILMEIIRVLAILLQPFIPASSANIIKMFEIYQEYGSKYEYLSLSRIFEDREKVKGTKIRKPDILFNKLI